MSDQKGKCTASTESDRRQSILLVLHRNGIEPEIFIAIIPFILLHITGAILTSNGRMWVQFVHRVEGCNFRFVVFETRNGPRYCVWGQSHVTRNWIEFDWIEFKFKFKYVSNSLLDPFIIVCGEVKDVGNWETAVPMSHWK